MHLHVRDDTLFSTRAVLFSSPSVSSLRCVRTRESPRIVPYTPYSFSLLLQQEVNPQPSRPTEFLPATLLLQANYRFLRCRKLHEASHTPRLTVAALPSFCLYFVSPLFIATFFSVLVIGCSISLNVARSGLKDSVSRGSSHPWCFQTE